MGVQALDDGERVEILVGSDAARILNRIAYTLSTG
jgi:hypothetical protein